MKAKMFTVGEYEVFALMCTDEQSSFPPVSFYARGELVPEMLFLEPGDKKDFKNFNEEKAKELMEKYSIKTELKAKKLDHLYRTNKKSYSTNGVEFIKDKGETMY